MDCWPCCRWAFIYDGDDDGLMNMIMMMMIGKASDDGEAFGFKAPDDEDDSVRRRKN